MKKCCGCDQKLKMWNHKIFKGNASWHKACWDAWHKGYDVALTHCEKMNDRFGLPRPQDIYWATTTGAVGGTPFQLDLLKKISGILKTPMKQKRTRTINPDTFRRKDG